MVNELSQYISIINGNCKKKRPVSVGTSYTLDLYPRCAKCTTKPTSFSGEQVSQKMSIGYIQCKKCVLLMLKCLGEVTAI